jgi:AraC-like DNA-binding protein
MSSTAMPPEEREAVYAELQPLGRHRGFLDHLYVLNDVGRLTAAGRSMFASPLCEIALARRDDDGADGWISLRAAPRFGRRPRHRAFCGWIIGLRYRPPSAVFDHERTALVGLADALTESVRSQNPLDDIIHSLDQWVEDLISEYGGSQALPIPAVDGGPTVAARAAAAGISSRTLQRHVRARTGLPPKRYASLQRFNDALRHVALEDASFAQIAADVGYSDQAHMTVDMARHAGLSPGRFRALARRQIRRDADRFFKDADLRNRLRLLVCDSGAPDGAATDKAMGKRER